MIALAGLVGLLAALPVEASEQRTGNQHGHGWTAKYGSSGFRLWRNGDNYKTTMLDGQGKATSVQVGKIKIVQGPGGAYLIRTGTERARGKRPMPTSSMVDLFQSEGVAAGVEKIRIEMGQDMTHALPALVVRARSTGIPIVSEFGSTPFRVDVPKPGVTDEAVILEIQKKLDLSVLPARK